jgi:hypothetical protein
LATSGVSSSSAKRCVSTASPAPLSSQVLAVAASTALRSASTWSSTAFSCGFGGLGNNALLNLADGPAMTSLTLASYCWASTASVVTAAPINMTVAVSVAPRQRTA